MPRWYYKIKFQACVDKVLDFFSRRRCLVCRKNIASRQDSCVCRNCEESLCIEDFSALAKVVPCGQNGIKVFSGLGFKGQKFKVYFATSYKNEARKLMKKYKYYFPSLYKFWGRFLAGFFLKNQDSIVSLNFVTKPKNGKAFIEKYKQVDDLVSLDGQWLAVPVPSHNRRIQKRGYCHTQLITKEFARSLKVKFVPDLLTRKKDTEILYDKSQEERQTILEGAFEFNSKATKKYKNLNSSTKIILIDDITTSGTTFLEAYKTLRKIFSSQIVCLACTGNNL